MKKEILILIIILSTLSASSVFALASCQSGGLTTSVNKEYQMTYSNEDFLQVSNIDLLKDVSQLKDLTCLQYMDATYRTVEGDISNLKNLKNLEVFSLYSNPNVSGDICSLAGATKLRSLKFAFDPKITGDISCLKNLNKLETFAMTHTQISGDLSVFANMPNLKAIYISGTNIKGNICALSQLTNLQELGIADEYPGNPDIIGDLSCLNNLKKLARVSLYNTNAINCEQFTKDHPNIEQGGCSKESMKTLVDYGQKYEKRIGKETQTEVRGQSNYQKNIYQKDNFAKNSPVNAKNINVKNSNAKDNNIKDKKQYAQPFSNPLTNIIISIKNLFYGNFNKAINNQQPPEDSDKTMSDIGPGGCKSKDECDAFCEKPENQETCLKFASQNTANNKKQEPKNKLSPLTQGRPGGCKTKAECEVYCSNPENREACTEFDPFGGGESIAENEKQEISVSKPVCRVSVLPSSKGVAPYDARVCIDNPNERIQQEYQDYVDFEGDGSWDDYQNSHGCHNYIFQKKGTFSPTAKIINSEGIESNICQTTIIVN